MFLLVLIILDIIAFILVFGLGQSIGVPMLVILSFSIVGVLLNRIIKLIYRMARGKPSTYQHPEKKAGKTSKKPK
jgi:UPF0716 family protein affecting phage T7 exclusion